MNVNHPSMFSFNSYPIMIILGRTMGKLVSDITTHSISTKIIMSSKVRGMGILLTPFK